MPIRTHRHDFGSYAELEIRYDADDTAAASYAIEVEQGLSTWLEAGISPPVEYDDRGIERSGSRRTAADCIVGALVSARRLVADGYATAREHRLVANLAAAYPSCAASAEQLFASLAGAPDAH